MSKNEPKFATGDRCPNCNLPLVMVPGDTTTDAETMWCQQCDKDYELDYTREFADPYSDFVIRQQRRNLALIALAGIGWAIFCLRYLL
jgi:transcription elongation factor Elf1